MRFFLRAAFAIVLVVGLAPRHTAVRVPTAPIVFDEEMTDESRVVDDTDLSAVDDSLTDEELAADEPAAASDPAADPAADPATDPANDALADDPLADDDAAPGPAFDYSAVLAALLASPDVTAQAQPSGGVREQEGDATWYDAPEPETCTHRSLPVGTLVQVTNRTTGVSAMCRISGWGPEDQSRIIDLSRDTFAKIADPGAGVVPVRLNW